MRIVALNPETRKDLLSRLLKRSPSQYPEQEKTVNEIISEIREKKDEALFSYTEKFDRIRLTPESLYVTEEEIRDAYDEVDPELVRIIRKAIENIRNYHMMQKRTSWFDCSEGIILGQKVTPLSKVGVYVPGGKASYPSSVLMNVVPARVAGVGDILVTTPCNALGKVNPTVLVAAKEAGVDRIAKIGGAQAIAAMAFGTESVPKVDKICGPGNIYVALAKKAVYGNVGIDSVAGPSEIMVLADASANARYIAADLMSQAEHDQLASAILVTDSASLAEEVNLEISRQLEGLSRREIIEKSMENYGYILVADSMRDAYDAVNEIASEHLEILTSNPFETMTYIKNAGAIFLGQYSSEPLGDYYAGPDHILPTNGTAKFFSPLSVDDFVKKSSVISYSREQLLACGNDIIAFANAEGLTAHANSIKQRMEK